MGNPSVARGHKFLVPSGKPNWTKKPFAIQVDVTGAANGWEQNRVGRFDRYMQCSLPLLRGRRRLVRPEDGRFDQLQILQMRLEIGHVLVRLLAPLFLP